MQFGENGLYPPAYLIHNLMANKAYITTIENCFKATSIAEQPSITKFPFSISEAIIPSRQFVMFKPNLLSLNGGIELAKTFSNYKFSEYNQEKREWSTYNISKNVMNDLLTKGIESSTENSLYLNRSTNDIEMAKYYKNAPHSHPVMYDILRNLELYTSQIQFTVEGSLDIDVGQVINVAETGDLESRREQFGGKWLISKVKHSFRNKEYRVNIIGTRRFYQQSHNYIKQS